MTITTTTTTVSSLPEDTFDQHHSLVPTNRLQPPTLENSVERRIQTDELKYFLGTATHEWDYHCKVRAFSLPTGESISCVFWDDMFHVTGTDIVRTLLYRFHLFGRPVTNLKKFEEGIFSDLRNLKPGVDASLEEPKSEFLEMLYKNNCIRTQKKQKVFYWFSVPHDRLFLDALERDLKREKMGSETTSVAIAEPATSLPLDSAQEHFDFLRKKMSLPAVAHSIDDSSAITSTSNSPQINHSLLNTTADDLHTSHESENDWSSWNEAFESDNSTQEIFGAFSLFEGSPTYKQRHRKSSSINQHHNQLELAAINAGLAVDPQMFSTETNHEKTFICPLSRCSRVFKRLEHLKRHFRTHTMERPYSCDMCAKSFSRSDNLTQHRKTHTRSRSTSLVSRSKETKDKLPASDEKPRIEPHRLRRTHLKQSTSSGTKSSDPYFYSPVIHSQCNSPTISPKVLFAPPKGDEVFDMSGLGVVDSLQEPAHKMVLTSEYYPPLYGWNQTNENSPEQPYPLTASSSSSSLVHETTPYSYYEETFLKDHQSSSWYSSAASSPTLCPSMYDQPSLSESYTWAI